MNNIFKQLVDTLDNMKCSTCHGHGECDDADFGDISFRTWRCTACNGSGLKNVEHVSEIRAYLQQLAPHQSDRQAARLLRAAFILLEGIPDG